MVTGEAAIALAQIGYDRRDPVGLESVASIAALLRRRLIDNNAAVRSLRATALGRKKFLFAAASTGGKRAAAIYTLIGTAKLTDMGPGAYLRHALVRIVNHPINRIDEPLPWRVAARLAPLNS